VASTARRVEDIRNRIAPILLYDIRGWFCL
jgi:hypothetical protein